MWESGPRSGASDPTVKREIRRPLSLRGAGGYSWRGWDILIVLVQDDSLWRVSWSLLARFCQERWFILKREGGLFVLQDPLSFNNPGITAVHPVPYTRAVLLLVGTGHGTREVTYQGILGGHIYPGGV